MSITISRARMGCLVAIAAVVGAFFGLVIGFIPTDTIPSIPATWPVMAYPLPHQIPKYARGVSLRFAMVHDVIHERYARHGEAYYRERNRLARQTLQEIKDKQGPNPSTDQYFGLFDDLGAGLDALKDDDEAVRVLRDKLRRQEELNYSGRQLYTTYANLGTFLIHGNFQKALAGDAAAKDQLREGIHYIAQSIEVNPEAHFGREVWQQRAAEFLLEAVDHPDSLLQRDLVGNALTEEIDPSKRRSIKPSDRADGVDLYFGWGLDRATAPIIEGKEDEGEHSREQVREWIATVGTPPTVPFDEPTLGIIGMWRLGGGANPHFALALGEIMLRVGQRHIAWSAYERATQMANRFWPDAAIQAKFVEHCRKRQAVIERQLPEDERSELRPRFESELAYGKGYQESYQAYEAKRIAEGASLDDKHFYDAFLADHEPIASPVGDEDYVHAMPSLPRWPNLAAIVLFAGLFAFGAAWLLRLIAKMTSSNLSPV